MKHDQPNVLARARPRLKWRPWHSETSCNFGLNRKNLEHRALSRDHQVFKCALGRVQGVWANGVGLKLLEEQEAKQEGRVVVVVSGARGPARETCWSHLCSGGRW